MVVHHATVTVCGWIIPGKQGITDILQTGMPLTRERLCTWIEQRCMILYDHEPVLTREIEP
jgi:hypothetical protein